jgi:hypothetical protein
VDLWQFAGWKSRVSKISIRKGPSPHRDCDGNLDEAAQAEFGAKAKALGPTLRWSQGVDTGSVWALEIQH